MRLFAAILILFALAVNVATGQDNSHSTFTIKKESACQVVIGGRIIHSGDTMSKSIFQRCNNIYLSGCGTIEHVISYDWQYFSLTKMDTMNIETSAITPKIHNWVYKQTDTASFIISNIVCLSTNGYSIIHNPIVLRLVNSTKGK